VASAPTAPTVTTPPKPGLGGALATAAHTFLGWLRLSTPDAGAGAGADGNTLGGHDDGLSAKRAAAAGGGASVVPPLAVPTAGIHVGSDDGDGGGSSRGSTGRHDKVD
jgi:DNA-binding transcriptional LysR family regulator